MPRPNLLGIDGTSIGTAFTFRPLGKFIAVHPGASSGLVTLFSWWSVSRAQDFRCRRIQANGNKREVVDVREVSVVLNKVDLRTVNTQLADEPFLRVAGRQSASAHFGPDGFAICALPVVLDLGSLQHGRATLYFLCKARFTAAILWTLLPLS